MCMCINNFIYVLMCQNVLLTLKNMRLPRKQVDAESAVIKSALCRINFGFSYSVSLLVFLMFIIICTYDYSFRIEVPKMYNAV